MHWYTEAAAQLPAAVTQAMCRPGTQAGGYTIQEVLYVSGSELYYRAAGADGEVLLSEMLPLRWCYAAEGSFVPYHAQSELQWNAARAAAAARLDILRSLSEEAALPEISDVFEEKGTLWYTMPLQAAASLRSVMDSGTLSPEEALELLLPVLDTLAGLHGQGITHGALTAGAIRLTENGCILRDWLGCTEGSTADVCAVSQLLYEMMTGETVYRDKAAAKLPAGIRNALYNGIHDPEMHIDTLWEQLHTARHVRRVQQVGKAAALLPWLAVLFCVVCLAVPVLYRTHCENRPTEEKKRLPDVAYALSEGEMQLPELLDLPQEEAAALLEEMGLEMILASRADNPTVPENAVATQQPAAGSIVRAGDTVMLGISDGWTNYVPDVCDLLLADAQKKLEDLGFVVEYEEVSSIGDAPGTVIAQDVDPETLLERDSTIRLTVSLGREDLDINKLEKVGNYVGMQFEEAKAQLSEIFLYALQIETVYDPEVPAGVIIEQDIAEGESVPQGTTIQMKVSLGVQMTRVPSVKLMGAGTAKSVLEAAGLKCVLCYVSNGDYVMDCVLSQNVAANSLVAVGTEVWLTVSIGTASQVISTGGWSGAPLPTVEETLDTSGPGEETLPPEEVPPITDPAEPDVPTVPDEPTTPYIPPATDPPPLTDPPAPPDLPDVPDVPDLEPPPMPVQ